MGFWDILEDPYDWLQSRFREQRVPGQPHSIFDEIRGANALGATTRGINKYNRGDDALSGGRLDKTGPSWKQGFQKRLAQNRIQEVLGELNRPPTTAELLAELQSLQDPSRYMQDEGLLAQQAREMVAAQYDPVIAQLRGQMGAAKTRAERNKGELGRMFSTLSSDLQGDVPEIQQMYTEDKAESQDLFNQLQQQTKDQYAQSATEQEQMMQRLNIEAAAPDILPEQQRDRDYFTQLAAQNAANEQTALGKEERGAINYTQQGSQIARMEGTQRQSDLMAQLSDLLTQYEGQIGAQEAAKNSAYLSALGELRTGSQNSALQQSQRDFENYISMIQLGRALNKDASGGQITSVKSPADVAGRALGMGLDQSGAQTVQDVFMSTISSDPQILSGMGVFGTSVPKEALAQRVVEAGRKAGLSREQLNVLQTIALEYFGRR
jgi:hypothetical protein